MIIQSKKVFIDDVFKEAQIEINNKIINIYPYNTKRVDKDYGNNMILPGFYDVHCHGFLGYDTNEAKEEGLRNWLKSIPSEGVCGICPTTITESHETLVKALKLVAKVYKDNDYKGARILGCHLEGPYISKEFKGAQPEKYIVKPNIKEFKEYQDAANGLIKIVTIAPEEDDNLDLIKYCAKTGVNVSLGHSAATFDKAKEAIEAGAKCFTHTYNGMSRFSHRDNNMVGAALYLDSFAEIICDTHHSTPEALNIFFKCKGKNGIMMTDGLMTKGLPIGTVKIFGGQEMKVIEDGTCRLTSTGNFAGSTLKINEGLKNLVIKANVPFAIALAACTSAPCRYLGIDDHKGYLKVNYDSDITILNDKYEVLTTYCEGQEFNYE